MTSMGDNKRIEAVDALRGFALAGIVIAHMYEQFISAPRPASEWLEPTLIDQIVSGFVNLFVYSKFFSIFSLLFGISFAIMMARAAERGDRFSGRFLWRLAILFLFGFLHSLVYRGDILTIYVSVGVLLPLLYGLSNRYLLVIAAVMFLGVGRYLFFFITGSTTLLPYQPLPDAPQVAEYVQTLKTGSFLEVAYENLMHGFAHKFDFQIGMIGRQYLTLGYFLVGVWLFRAGYVRNIMEHKSTLKRVLWWSLGLMILFYVLMGVAFATLPQPINMASWHFMFALTLYDFASLAGTAVIAAGFLLLYMRSSSGRLGGKLSGKLSGFAGYGRAALSNYILQSLVGTFIFYGWGLGLLGQLHDWQTLLLALLVIYLQICLSTWWLSRYQYGPLEWLWRYGTWFKAPNFRLV